MWWKSKAEVERENNETMGKAGCGCFLVIFILGVIGNFFVKSGDIIYYPFKQSAYFSDERRVETLLRGSFGSSHIVHIENRDLKECGIGGYASGAKRSPAVSDVQKIEVGGKTYGYGAKVNAFNEEAERKVAQFLRFWGVNSWGKENMERIYLRFPNAVLTLLKKDTEREGNSTGLFKYLQAEGRFTNNTNYPPLKKLPEAGNFDQYFFPLIICIVIGLLIMKFRKRAQ